MLRHLNAFQKRADAVINLYERGLDLGLCEIICLSVKVRTTVASFLYPDSYEFYRNDSW